MSPRLQRQIAESEDAEARELARLERQRAVRAEQWRERSLQAAITEALERGEDVDMPRALRGEQLGHEPAEFVALVSARQDLEDMQAEAAQRRAFARWQAGLSASSSGDLSAPTSLQLEAGAQTQARAESYRRRVRDHLWPMERVRQQTASQISAALR